MNWFKESQYRTINQKDFHRQTLKSYRRKMLEAKRQLAKHRKNHRDSLVDKYEKRIMYIESRMDYHKKRILYYERREEKQKRW